MSTINEENNEIDLSKISKKIGRFFERVSIKLFLGIFFIKKNTIIVSVILVFGGVLGFVFDKFYKVYDHQIIVTPNFNSTDYLYAKIDLINSKIKEGDTLFLKNVVGIQNPKLFKEIEIEPIVDIYKFIGTNPVNFEFVKLLGEDGDLKKIVVDPLTSRNYTYQNISFSTSKPTNSEKTIKPLLKYLNDSEYFAKIQKIYVENITAKIKENDSIISQINGVLNSFSKTINSNQKSSNLVYYNENTQLNEVIKTKDELITEQGSKRLEFVDSDKIIKDSSSTINIINDNGINGKFKLVLPLILLGIFFLFRFLKFYYFKQLAKSKQ